MVLESDAQRLLSELLQLNTATIRLAGEEVSLCLFDNNTKLLLTTSIFRGGDYVPPSVRQACGLPLPQMPRGSIRTAIRIDESTATASLTYIGLISTINQQTFKPLLEEFGWLAREWRHYLDDKGRGDLIRVPVK
jgi:hypothetical protein